MRDPANSRIHHGAIWYAGAAVLVVGYVNTFEIWGWLVASLGPADAALVPFGILLVLVGGGGIGLLRHGRPLFRGEVGPVVVGIGIGLIALALILVDPTYPAKRVHVPQYVLLALVLRLAAAGHMGGWMLTGTGAVLTLLFGIHDELLQGLHPNRSYGLPDILVNGLSGAGGTLVAHGLGLFAGKSSANPVIWRHGLPGVLAILAGTAFMVLTLPSYRDAVPPVWVVLPLLAGGAVWFAGRRPGCPALRHSFNAVVWTCLPMVFYPVLSHVTSLVFR